MPLRLPRAAPPTRTATTALFHSTPPLSRSLVANSSCSGLLRPWSRVLHSSSTGLNAFESRNHYERLNLSPDATPADIKKSFYALSKTHHPDANPSNPHAASTFSLLSESYTLLSDPARRTTYDRDVLRLHHHSAATHAPSRGSYHSSNPAGGRSPSGLSKRRGTFRGPPPSFYRNGGWGGQGEKRRKAHEESTGAGGEQHDAEASSTAAGSKGSAGEPGAGPWAGIHSQYGGMGPGSHPFNHGEEVPHFDRAGHTRTHRREDHRRWQRERRAVGDDDVEFEPQMSLAGHFFIIAGILGATFLAPLVYLQFMRLGRKKKDV